MSYKKKFITVSVLALVITVFSFYRSILPTLRLVSQCSKMEAELDSTRASSDELLAIKTELEGLNAMIGSEKESIDEINRGIVDFIGKNSGTVKLTGFPPVHRFMQNQFTLYTHQAEVEGNFKSLLQLLYEMENRFEAARICAVKFASKEDFRTKKKHLYGTFYIQNIRKNF